jgi:hypothetical protein
MFESGELPFRDYREFALYDYRHGHSFVLVRGFPEQASTDSSATLGPTLDLVFGLVTRVSCARDFSPLLLRYASADESTVIERRVGPLRSHRRVYLLEPDTMESYIVASELTAAEFLIGGGAESPLTSINRDYVAANPPRTGPFRF